MKKYLIVILLTIVLPVSAQDYDKYEQSENYCKGMEYFEKQDYYRAEEFLRKELEEHRDNGYAYMLLALIQIRDEDYFLALASLDRVIEYFPDFSKGYSYRAETYLRLGEYAAAASDIVRALEIDSDDRAFRLMMEVADSSFMLMNTALTIKEFSDPDNPYWPYCLGIINDRTGKLSDAIAYYRKSAALKESPIHYQMLARCFEKMSDWTSALENIDEAIRLDPDDGTLIWHKAMIYYETGEVKEAITLMDDYLRWCPFSSIAYCQRGHFKDSCDIDGAIEDYTISILLNPDYPNALVYRGDLYLLKGEKKMAMEDFNTAVQMDTIPGSDSRKMFALIRLGRNEEAVNLAEQMLQSYPGNTANYNAACVYSLLGQTEKALSHLEKSMKTGYKSLYHLMTDRYLENIRHTDAFQMLLERYGPK